MELRVAHIERCSYFPRSGFHGCLSGWQSFLLSLRAGWQSFLLSLRAGAYFNFNEVGTQIWEMLARSCRAGEIFRGLLRHYEVDEKTLVVHVATFWEQLAKDRLVKLVDVG